MVDDSDAMSSRSTSPEDDRDNSVTTEEQAHAGNPSVASAVAVSASASAACHHGDDDGEPQEPRTRSTFASFNNRAASSPQEQDDDGEDTVEEHDQEQDQSDPHTSNPNHKTPAAAPYMLCPYDTRILELPLKAFFVHDVFMTKLEEFCVNISPLLVHSRKLESCSDVSCFFEVKEELEQQQEEEPIAMASLKSEASPQQELETQEQESQPRCEDEEDKEEQERLLQQLLPSRKILFCGTHDSLEDLEHALKESWNVPFMQWLMNKDDENAAPIVKNSGFAVFTMWHRVNELFDAAKNNGSSNNGAGGINQMAYPFVTQDKEDEAISRNPRCGTHYFVRKTHSVNEPSQYKALVLRVIYQMSELARPSQKYYDGLKKQEEHVEGDGQPNGSGSEEDSGCLFYDILVSNDTLDRFHEVEEWTGWTSKEAYEAHAALPMTLKYRQIMDRVCNRNVPSETTVWEHKEEMFVSSEDSPELVGPS